MVVNVYVGHMSYFHKPSADGSMMDACMYYLNFFVSLVVMLSPRLKIHA